MTPRKKARIIFLLVTTTIIFVSGVLARPGIDNFSERTKAAVAAFSGSAPAEEHYSPVSVAQQSSVVSPPASKKQKDPPPRQATVSQKSPDQKFPKQVVMELGWVVEEPRRNVFKVPELKFVNREFTLLDAGLAKETCNQLIEGPAKIAAEEGCRSDINTQTKVLSVKIENETLYLKLSEKPSRMGERQFRETLGKLNGVKRVEFL